MESRFKIPWPRLLLTAVLLAALVLAAGCSEQGQTRREEQRVEKDYTGAAVADLPKNEQIIIASSVELSAIVNWGEGGPMYDLDVAEAFMLGLELPRFEDGKYTPQSPGEKDRNASVFLSQVPHTNPPAKWQRYINMHVDIGGVYDIFLDLDETGKVLNSWSYFRHEYEDNEGNTRTSTFVTHMEHPTRLRDLLTRVPDSTW